MVDGYNEKLGCFEQEEKQTCETCYYAKFDGCAYPCSRCIHNKPMDDMWQPKESMSEWIPVSEKLPENSGDYLVRPSDGVLEDYSDFSEVMIIPYDADCEAFGWWNEKYDPVTLGYIDSDFDEFEVIAWMPLPEPYVKEQENE